MSRGGASSQVVKGLFQPLAKLAKDQGWTISQTNGGHYQWSPPWETSHEDPPIITSQTCSDRNIVKTVENQLRNAGLIVNPDLWKREKTRRRQIERKINEVYTPQEMVLRWTQLYPNTPADITTLAALAYVYSVADVDGYGERLKDPLDLIREFPNSCSCGVTFKDTGLYAKHALEYAEDPRHAAVWNGPANKENQPDVDRNLDTPPPMRERLECPECDFYCWISQPHLLDAHLEADHNMAMCPGCKRVMLTTSIERHKSDYCTVLNPVRPPRRRRHLSVADEAEKILADAESVPDRVPLAEIGDAAMTRAEAMDWHPASGPSAAATAPQDPLLAIDPPPPPQPPTTTQPPDVPSATSMTEDDLFAMLELVLGGPIEVNRDSFAAINRWMEATKDLMRFRS